MTWPRGGNTRTTKPEHRALRLKVLKRDHYTCYLCGSYANRCDAVIPRFEGGAHDEANCKAICLPCDRAKSAAEGVRARQRTQRKRPTEPHPGLR